MRIQAALLFFLVSIVAAKAQVVNTATMDTLETTVIGHLAIGGYIDTYYGYYSNRPKGKTQSYAVSSARHNEFNINLAYVDLRYRSSNFRARFVPGFGTYMNANYAAEPGVLKSLVEANVGVKLFKNKNIWLDAGVLGSPFTNESAISKDHLMYSRSLAPENVPYYLSGVKISVPLSSKVTAYAYVLNGWQQIEDKNEKKSLATQLEYRPNSKMLWNWNVYAGDERSVTNPTYRQRLFSDVFWIFKPNKKFDATSCFYFGQQQFVNRPAATWWQGNFIARYSFDEKFSLSGRVEIFKDSENVMLATPLATPYEVIGLGACLNVKISHNALFRLDARQLSSDFSIFETSGNQVVKNSFAALASLTAWF